MDILYQIIMLLALIAGVIVGEGIATRVFGQPKKSWLWIIEILIFVVVLVVVSNEIYVYDLNIGLMSVINGIVGMLTALVSRTASTALGKAGVLPEAVLHGMNREERLALNVARELGKRRFGEKRIREVLEKSGFNKKEIELALEAK